MKTQPAQPKSISNRRPRPEPALTLDQQPGRPLNYERLAESSPESSSDDDSDAAALQHRLPLEPEDSVPSQDKPARKPRRSTPASRPPDPVRPAQESLQLPQFAPVQTPPTPPDTTPVEPAESHELARRHPSPDTLQQQIQSGTQYLAATAARINQLSTELETALFDLKAISTQVNQDRRALREFGKLAVGQDSHPACEYAKAAVPRVRRHENGSFRLVMRRVDLLKPEREAASTAQFLRNWLHQTQIKPEQSKAPVPPSPAALTPALPDPVPRIQRRQKPWRWLKRWLKPPQDRSAMVTDAVLWIAGAAILRLGLQWVLVAYPSLWMPGVLLLVTSALVLAYQVTFMAQSGLILGYRLLLLLVGLLLGGRL